MRFEILERFAELRQGLFQIIREHRRLDQVGRRTVVVGARSLLAQVSPAVEIAVATAEPHQGDQIDLFVDIQAADEAGKLGAIGVLL